MKTGERVLKSITIVAFKITRAMVLRLSDRTLGRIFRVVERLAYAISADRAVKNAAAEVADIFESGPPFTTTVRRMFEAGQPELLASSIRCLRRPSPYGAK